ncbi:MAG: hypothetical protein VW230_07875 [Candidatus Poseidoniales archaeon]
MQSDETESFFDTTKSRKLPIPLMIFGIILVSIALVLDFDKDGLSNISEIITHDTDFLELDSDRDGLNDKYEIDNNLDPSSEDSDFDGLKDGQEVKYTFSNPLIADTDNDSLSDGVEVMTLNTNPLIADSDYDNLSDYYEIEVSQTNPNKADSDGDNITDGDEINTYRTNPMMFDSDQDELSDYQEIFEYLTEPNEFDSDEDSLSDGYEVLTTKSNPLLADTDADGIEDSLDVDPLADVQVLLEFGFQANFGDSWSAPDPYFEFYMSHNNQTVSYSSTQIFLDTYVKQLDASGALIYDWDDSSEFLEIQISGYDSDSWNADERLDLGGPDTSDITITLTFDSIINQWTMSYTSSYGTDQDASYYEGYPCDFSLRISVIV